MTPARTSVRIVVDPVDLNGDLAALVVSDVPRAAPTELAGDVRDALVHRAFSSAGDIVVLDGDRLLGVIPLETLLAADPDVPVGGLIEAEPAMVREGADRGRRR